MRHIFLLFLLPLVTITNYSTPQDRQADNVRRLPPAGIKISDADRAELTKDVAALEQEIKDARKELQGLPASNSVLKKIVGKLPIRWADGKLHADKTSYDADTHAPILIYPNPLNPSKYIVLNSGHTFREESNRSNARQTPKLPDWAIIDITTPPNSYHPGKVVDAGFFGEQWEWKKQVAR